MYLLQRGCLTDTSSPLVDLASLNKTGVCSLLGSLAWLEVLALMGVWIRSFLECVLVFEFVCLVILKYGCVLLLRGGLVCVLRGSFSRW